ncbi:hypothetical protein PGQ11_002335 [Apiospora arundinis]|uniref:Uncharacterized protein n=1 Tax=Apiospora arundinis TaxID=335852 RepID=A0ABR2JHZ8_9PEZI
MDATEKQPSAGSKCVAICFASSPREKAYNRGMMYSKTDKLPAVAATTNKLPRPTRFWSTPKGRILSPGTQKPYPCWNKPKTNTATMAAQIEMIGTEFQAHLEPDSRNAASNRTNSKECMIAPTQSISVIALISLSSGWTITEGYDNAARTATMAAMIPPRKKT